MDHYDKLVEILEKHSIDEVGLLPCDPPKDDMPIQTRAYHPLLLIDTKLGISLEALTILLQQAHEQFVNLPSTAPDQTWEQVSRVMILLKPDNTTAMNARKRLVHSGVVSVQRELALLDLIFTVARHTKSAAAWHHREWLLTREPQWLDMSKERRLCSQSATLHPRNYYAWSHRRWLLERILDNRLAVDDEYHTTTTWIEHHVSDHSAVHHLGQLLPAWLGFAPSSDSCQARLKAHLVWVDTTTQQYPGHEALWMHRRTCAQVILTIPDLAMTDWVRAQHRWIDMILQYQPLASDLDTSPDKLQQQRTHALHFGTWLCLWSNKALHWQIPDDRYHRYLGQLRSLDDRPCYQPLSQLC
ncbi:protein prenylyltransferase [Hesseltinella vesiculosa]|uniref:Protein prenylyltransferase n=1 Tax=Hesseltinella vesiculosa TaxID=101127 RepID=A0A1X2GSW9_9FUNG|nr:protein prenylyltransferase [Hesseltinella vesiculosa]